jgi:uncharacterized membrane protein
MNNPMISQGDLRSVDAGRGLAWWTEAWAIFAKNPGAWVVLGLIMLVIFIVLGVIPILGGLAAALLAPVFTGSWMLAARKAEGGAAPEVNDLFTGFKDKLTPLLVVGLMLLAGVIVIGIVAFGTIAGAFAGGGRSGTGGMFAALAGGLLTFAVCLVLGAVLGMAFWFAPALVVLRDMAPLDAVKASFAGSLKNIVPFVVWTVIYIIAAIVASIPFGLGWVVLLPLLMLTVYIGCRDIFGA